MAPRPRRTGSRARGARLILCSGTLGDAPFEVKARAAAAAGFDGISIYAREHRPGLRRLLDGLDLAVAEVDGASGWLPGQPGPPFARMVEIAAELGARSITVLEVTGERPDPAAARDAFAAACDAAAVAGVAVHLEPFAWSGVATLAAARAIVEGSGGGILLDVCHHVLGPDAGVLDHAAVPCIVAVQVADPGPSRMVRSLPGPVTAAVLAELPALPVEVEVFGLGGDPAEAACRAFVAMQEVADRRRWLPDEYAW